MLHRSNVRVSQQTQALAGKAETQGPIESKEQTTMTTRKTTARAKAQTAAKPVEVAAKPVEVAAEAVQETVETVEQAVKAGTKAASEGYQAGTKAASEGYQKAADAARKQGAQASKVAFDGYGDFASAGKENIEAVVKSGAVMVKGMEILSHEIMAFAKASIEGNMAATKAVLGAKSVNEAVDLQAQFARRSFDQAMAESAKLTEMSIKMTNEAVAPIQARVNVAVDQVAKPIAF